MSDYVIVVYYVAKLLIDLIEKHKNNRLIFVRDWAVFFMLYKFNQ